MPPSDEHADAPRPSPFPRRYRLKRQRLIRPFFERRRGDVQSVRANALVVRYRLASRDEVGAETPLQIGFATGRRLGGKPDRNRVKRALRETFRLHQHRLAELFADRSETLTLFVLWRGGAEGATAAVHRDLPMLLDRIADGFTVKPSER